MFVKGVGVSGFEFVLVSATTGAAVTGATVTAKISKDGGAQASCTNAVVELAGGQYKIDLTAAEMTATLIGLLFTATGAIPIGFTIPTVAMNLDANAGTPLTAGTGTAQLNVASGKAPATLAATDVTGNVAADVQTIKTQTITCSAGVTVLASVGTATTNIAQTGDAYARIGAAGSGLTALGDARIANLDAAVSTRSVYAGGAVASVTAPVTVGTLPSPAPAGYGGGTTPIHSGTARGGTATTITLDTGASATDNLYQCCQINTTGGTGANQTNTITFAGYVGSTRVATVTVPWAVIPDSTTTFAIFPLGAVVMGQIGGGVRTVTQDYLGADRLTVDDGAGSPVAGATVTAYLAAAFASQSTNAPVIASTTTDTLGHWTLSLAPSEYTLRFAFANQASYSTFVVS